MPALSWKNYAVNDIPERSLYNDAAGMSLGVRVSALTPYTISGADDMGYGSSGGGGGGSGSTSGAANMDASGAPSAVGSNAPSKGLLGEPLSWWVVLLVLLVALMWAAKRVGDSAAEDFKSIKLSMYNIVVISIAAIIGLGFFKAVFNKWKIPGLTTFINAV